MRPDILTPLFRSVSSLPGVGPRNAKLLEKLAGPRVVDLAWLLPREIVERYPRRSLAELQDGEIATVSVRVARHDVPRTKRQPYRVLCEDASGELTLVFFHAREDYLRKLLPVDAVRMVSGTVENFRGTPQMTHPDYVVAPASAAEIPLVEPVYPLTEGLTLRTLGKIVRAGLELLPDLPEWQDPSFCGKKHWPSWKDAVLSAHAPQNMIALRHDAPARARLAYDELLSNQLALQIIRAQMRRRPGRSIEGDGRLRQQVLAALPYQLTDSQRLALSEIEADMAAASPMLRLLQGDVGSGKTIVALLTMLNAVEAGGQAALMAPTEILARQHHATIAPLAQACGLEVSILTGREKGTTRRRILESLRDGSARLIVGTHALFQDDVELKELLLAVIDEQHRFGVHQRLALSAKGKAIDVLVMTATPIPRTLLLTAYGDMETSQLREKPAGRRPIDTRIISSSRLSEVVDAVGRKLADGARVYWVCPLVEESEASDLTAAEQRFAELRHRFGTSVALVHGRMKGSEKDRTMERFASGDAKVLVATTVIEVGVDVPEATLMVIEHAERFGLAQLHQLRGRVGRGQDASTCLLVYGPDIGETGRARLKIMRDTEDGFRIAEEDLLLRGGGEILGTRQSGLPSFRLADLAHHGDLLATARDDAKLILHRDRELKSERGNALRTMLYLFERDAAVLTLRSG